MRRAILVTLALLVCTAFAYGQEPFEGLTMISPLNSNDTYLMDMDGTILKTRHGANRPASFPYMLADGAILRPCQDSAGQFSGGGVGGGVGGRIQKLDADDNLLWDFYYLNVRLSAAPRHPAHAERERPADRLGAKDAAGGHRCRAAYIAFGTGYGFMERPPGSGTYNLLDVHGAGCQRSDPKEGDPADYPYGRGPQGDVIRIYNYVRAVRGCRGQRGDFDCDGDVDLDDYATFAAALAGPGVSTAPASSTAYDFARADFDGDGDVDLTDCKELLLLFGN